MRRDRRSVVVRQSLVAVIWLGGVAIGWALGSIIVTGALIFAGIVVLLALQNRR